MILIQRLASLKQNKIVHLWFVLGFNLVLEAQAGQKKVPSPFCQHISLILVFRMMEIK